MSSDPETSLVPLKRETVVPSSDRGRLAAIVATCSLAGLAGGMALSMIAETHRAAQMTRDPGRARYHHVHRAHGTGPITWLGVTIQDATPTGCGGALVTRVEPGSPARLGGLENRDLITHFGGDRICDADHLTDVVRASAIGATPSVSVRRGAQEVVLHPTLIDMPASHRADYHGHHGRRR